MLRSKRITDYVEAKLEDVRAGDRLPMDVHLYFSSNRHILVWRKSGEVISDDFIAKYRARGIDAVWIHRDDLATWDTYRGAASAQTNPGVAAARDTITEVGVRRDTQTEEGGAITSLMENGELSERHRMGLIARAARELLYETAQPAEPALRAESLQHARAAVRDILDCVLEDAARDVRKAIDEMWSLGELDPELRHAINVATFAVLFAMAFGRISPELLGDIALAALLHDVGLTQVPSQIASRAYSELQGREHQIYERHVDEGLRLLDELASGLSPRVRPLIQQHHEKFNGTGYPTQLQGFQVNDVAQIVAIADAIESMASGQWDGQNRSLMEALDVFEQIEGDRTHPEHFNPDVFSAVLRWVRSPGALSSKLKAADIVRSTTRDMMRKARA